MNRDDSDEVRVVIENSDSSKKGYWNLRMNESHSRDNESDSNKREKFNPKSEIEVRFRLDEKRELTESQKQAILSTLTGPEEKYLDQEDQTEQEIDLVEEPDRKNWNYKSIKIALLTIFGVLGLILLVVLVAAVLAEGNC